MSFRRTIQLKEDAKRRDQADRTRGYEDGYGGRDCALKTAAYTQAWRRGREAKRVEGELP